MKKQFLTTTALAVAALALVAPSSKAQTAYSGNYTQGDFLLGFRVTGGTGAGSDVLVDLGSIGNGAAQTTFNTPNLDSLLVGTFGSNWYTRTDLLYSSVAGASGNNNTYYASSPESVGGSEAFAWANPSNTQGNQLLGKFNGEGASYQSAGATIASPAVLQTTGSTNSYASYQPGGTVQNSNGISYAYFNPSNEGSNPSATTLDVFQLTRPAGGGVGGDPGVDVGDLTINSNGVVSFTPDSFEAVPEPSTYAAAALAVAGLGFFHLRRRAAKA